VAGTGEHSSSSGAGNREAEGRDFRRTSARSLRRWSERTLTWGEARVASELAVKLGLCLSPRTIRAYWPEELRPHHGSSSQRWMTFVRNHAKAIVACDFVVAVTLRLKFLYVFVVMKIGSRRLLHVNATAHPTSAWTVQQLREAIPSNHGYPWLIPDRCGIFSNDLDRDVGTLGVAVLKTPVRAPKAKDSVAQ